MMMTATQPHTFAVMFQGLVLSPSLIGSSRLLAQIQILFLN
jgi:hypothetical protein